MPRKSLEVRREEILGETARQLQERGLAGIRALDVARALGVSTGLIFYHFDTMERLLAATFDHAAQRDLEQLQAVLDGPGDALGRLWAVLDLYAPTGEAAGWTLWIDGWSAALRDDQLRAVVRRLDRRWKRAIAALVQEAATAGTLGKEVDPAGAATRITALLDGLAVQRLVRGDALSAGRLRSWVRAYARSELGLAPG
jgi:AcrR family transcriptional regulator